MSQFRTRRGLTWLVMLALLSAVACSRPSGVPAAGTPQDNAAPFRPDNPRDSEEPSTAPGSGFSAGNLPFHDSQSLPAGTLLTVRLKGELTAGTSISRTGFEAIVDQPVVVDGNTLLPRGTTASGRIEAVRISTVKPNRAYVRLALESVHVGGVDVPVQTASLFARQSSQSEDLIRLEKGRRLTFRLTEPLVLSTQRAQMGH